MCGGKSFYIKMTTLYFRHSWVYESMLSRLDGLPYSAGDSTAAWEHINKFSEYWKQHNDKVFEHFESLGLRFAEFWIAYFVRPRDSIIPFSDPLTIFIDDDFEKTLSVIVHELVHVMLVYPDNEDITRKIFKTLDDILPLSSFELKAEITPALVSRVILSEIFGLEKAAALQSRERKFPILGEAWQIIDRSPGALSEKNPLLAIEKLLK